jgi:diguanylate cyclase (GGDEF)-like protein/PAS domain S-box-containing protein
MLPAIESSPVTPTIPGLSAGRILVVDDERTNREILARLLQRNGYATTAVESGQEAIELVSTQTFDAVMLDLIMPGIDGFDCLKAIRSMFSTSELPVVMVTAESDRDQVVAAFRMGANDYVTKPIDRDITLARVSAHARLRKTMQALRESEERYALAARGSNDGLWNWNLLQEEVYYSARWKSMLGFEDHEVSRSPSFWTSRVHPDDISRFRQTMTHQENPMTTHLECELRMLHRDGGYRWMLCRGVYVRNRDGQVYRMAGSLTDITEGKVGDPLTGLPNRLLFVDRLERTIDRARRLGEGHFAVLFLDLDKFKLINDSYGHQAGDRLLIEVARRLEISIRSVDTVVRGTCQTTVARHAGDEFTVLLESISSPEDADLVADRIIQAFTVPIELDSVSIFPTFSIGLALGDHQTACAEDLMREADTAMYHAKSEGRNRRRRFEAGMQQKAAERLALEQDLRRALNANEFFLQFQPIVQLHSGVVTGFETLVRWQHPERGVVSPLAFIRAAEEMGLIVPLGWWIIETACHQAALWQAQFPFHPRPSVSINCSVQQLYQPDFIDTIREILDRTGTDPHGICLEVTESTLMDRPDAIRPILFALRDLGIQISVDDFGTGYSSLAYLHRFPLDILKIDRSFVNTLQHSGESSEIIRTIINLAHSLDLSIVAEGVETEEQWKTLRHFGATHAQGYLVSPPVNGSFATQYILDHRPEGPRPDSRNPSHPKHGSDFADSTSIPCAV